VSFIRTGLREIGLKIRRQKTRMALRHEKRVLQKSEIALGREGVSQAVNFPEVRNEIVALKKLEQEQKEVAVRIATIEEAVRKIELQREQNAREQNAALEKLEEQKKPVLQQQQTAKSAADLCDRELAGVERRLQENDAADRELMKKLAEVQALVQSATLQGANTTDAQRAFAVLPTQTMQIGNRILTHVSLVTPVAVAKNLPRQREDGLLPTVLFQRVLISGRGHFVVFDPK